uniref:Tetratricopeptide repeat protein n=1 Tax=candidate division WOR-3 bacterium TaxID=2052148 RepID=A0A7V3RI08_UNCW3
MPYISFCDRYLKGIIRYTLGIFPILIMATGCAYFNTFYNAQNYFSQGMKTVKNDTLKSDVEYFDKAIEKCASVIAKYPDSRYVDDAIYMMGVSYYFKGDYSRALEKLDFLTTNFPGSRLYSNAMYYSGLAYYKTGRYSKAIIAFKEVGRFKKLRKKAYVMLCYAYYQDGNYRDLMYNANLLLKERLNRKERLMVLNILSEVQYELKDYEATINTLNEIEKMVEIPEEKKKIKLRMANIYLETGKFEECKKFLENESDPEFRMLLAGLYFKMNVIDTAKMIYQEIKETQPQEYVTKAYYELAQIAETEDSLELAIAYYDSLIPKATGELFSKAKVRSEVLKKIVDLKNKKEEMDKVQFSLGEIYFIDLKDIPRAMEYYENVYKNYPYSPLAPKALYANLWISKMVLKQDSTARNLAEELIKNYPETEYAKSAQVLMHRE